jgi:hypothetical protein
MNDDFRFPMLDFGCDAPNGGGQPIVREREHQKGARGGPLTSFEAPLRACSAPLALTTTRDRNQAQICLAVCTWATLRNIQVMLLLVIELHWLDDSYKGDVSRP